MPMLGQAALAMWWDVGPDARQELEHWHAHEHFPERLSLPGFLRASRWTAIDGGEGFFVMYELEAHQTLTSERYVERFRGRSRVLDAGCGRGEFLEAMRSAGVVPRGGVRVTVPPFCSSRKWA